MFIYKRIVRYSFSNLNRPGIEYKVNSFYDAYCQENYYDTTQVHGIIEKQMKLKYFDRSYEIIMMHLIKHNIKQKEQEIDHKFIKLVGINKKSLFNDIYSILSIDSVKNNSFKNFIDGLKTQTDKIKNIFYFNIKTRENRKQLKNKFIDAFQLYNDSLQEIVEGQREVMNNKEFVFEDGETTEMKRNKFKAKFKSMLSKMSSAFKNKKP